MAERREMIRRNVKGTIKPPKDCKLPHNSVQFLWFQYFTIFIFIMAVGAQTMYHNLNLRNNTMEIINFPFIQKKC